MSTPTSPVIRAVDSVLKAVDKFCYLGSILAADVSIDNDIVLDWPRLAKHLEGSGSVSGMIMAYG
jgi:hypothetical protein